MIVGFRSREAAKIWDGEWSRRLPPEIQAVALRKLRLLNNARTLQDLAVPPSNLLEALKGDRAGPHSIRINDKWRICCVWETGRASWRAREWRYGKRVEGGGIIK